MLICPLCQPLGGEVIHGFVSWIHEKEPLRSRDALVVGDAWGRGCTALLKVGLANDYCQGSDVDSYLAMPMLAISPQNLMVQCFVGKWKGDEPVNDLIVVDDNAWELLINLAVAENV